MEFEEKEQTSRQRARAETRNQLLKAGEELAREAFGAGTADPLRFLSSTAITERAARFRPNQNLSPGMIYHLWKPEAKATDKLQAYRVELLKNMLDVPFDASAVGREAASVVHRFHASREDQQARRLGQEERKELLEELVRVVGAFDFERYRHGGERAEEMRFSSFLLLAAESSLSAADDETRRLTLEQMQARSGRTYESLRDMYGKLLDQLGLRMAEGFDVDDLVQGLWAMLDGFASHSWHFDNVHKERTWRGADRWYLFSIFALFAIQGMTEPASPEEDTNLT